LLRSQDWIEISGTDVRAWFESSLSLSLSLGRERGRDSKSVPQLAASVNAGKDKTRTVDLANQTIFGVGRG
jgi:hypothetical protein